MIIAVVSAVQTSRPLHVREDELRILRGAWRVATDQSRLLFLSTIEPNEALAMFLWEQVVPPEFQVNSFRARRSIALTLARMGPTAWAVLAPRWSDIVRAAQSTDLSPLSRVTPHWRTVGVPLASLSWILPGVVASLSGRAQDDGRDLLRDTVAAVTGAGRADGYLMEPGLEISLADGFKMAATVGHRDGHTPPWQDEAVELLEKAHSWVSCLALQQCITLCGWANREASRAAGPHNRRKHPFVREAIALMRRTDTTSHGSLRPSERSG
jgi:hypothetical protein